MTNRKAHWEKVYSNKTPLEVSWYQKEPTLSLQFIRNAQPAYDAPIIDVGGGASVLVDYLFNDGYTNVAVLDLSAKALACARNRLGDNAKQIEWYEDDITRFKPPHEFAIWHDRAVFHFLTDASDRNNYIKVLETSLQTSGQLIIAAFALGGPTQCSGLDIVQYDTHKLTAELGDDFELIEEKRELHNTPSDKLQAFTYFRFIKKA